MHFRLSPITVGVLTAMPAAFPVAASAAELGQVVVSDAQGSTQVTLDSGSSVTYTGTGSAISVSTSGNLVRGDGIQVSATGVNTQRAIGVQASLGGAVQLSNSTVATIGTQQSSHALYATGSGSTISGTNLTVSTAANYSYGAYAQSGGQIILDGGAIATAGAVGHGLYVDGAGSTVTANALDIRTTGVNGVAVNVYGGGRADLTDVRAASASGTAVSADGAGSTVRLKNTTVEAASGTGVYVRAAEVSMQGGSVTSSGDALMLATLANHAGAVATIQDATLTSANGYGVNLNAPGATAILENVSISALGVRGTGAWIPGIGASLVARNLDLDSWMVGIDNRAGQVTLQDGSVLTHGSNAHALYASREYGDTASIVATGTRIRTYGLGAVGALARVSGASVTLTNTMVDTEGNTAYGLFASGSGSEMAVTGSAVATLGAGASGVAMSNGTSVALDATRLSTAGANAHGVWSYGTSPDVTNNLRISNGSRVETTDGVGLLASGGNHNFTLSDTTIATQTAGDGNNGILLRTLAASVTNAGVTTVIQTGRANLDASRSILTGDIIADNGGINVALSDHSVLTGALVSRAGRIDSMLVDGTSLWNIRADSALGALNNAGTVAFQAPSTQSGFKTLTVRDYTGGGVLIMNTQLGGDGSPTDKLVIDGGTASGVTRMRIVNAGGAGGLTQQGIRVVETINGGATAPNAFHLDSGSPGFRSSTGTVAINGYDYSLARGGNQGVESDWYLTSSYQAGTLNPVQSLRPQAPPDATYTASSGAPGATSESGPVVLPADPAAPVAPDVAVPAGPQFRNVSPESGAYLGNQSAATRLFMHGLYDRDQAHRFSAEDAGDGPRSRIWIRAHGAHQDNLRMRQGDVHMDTDSGMVQLGGDLVDARLGQEGRIVAGVMAGYGDARVRSTAGLRLPGTSGPAYVNARGRVTGYSAGMYATAYANDATRMGAYADSWVQYGRYSNEIDSELGSARYRSNTWTVSVESGYAFRPFASTPALASMVAIPQVQLAYTHYDAKDAVLPTMRLENRSTGQVYTRAGVRVYPLGMAGPDAAIRPFVEANWLHASGAPQVNIGSSAFSAVPARNAAELKLGAQGRVGKSTFVTGYVSGQEGSGNQRGYAGMLNLVHRW